MAPQNDAQEVQIWSSTDSDSTNSPPIFDIQILGRGRDMLRLVAVVPDEHAYASKGYFFMKVRAFF